MKVRLVRQPLAGGGSLHGFLEEATGIAKVNLFVGVVAWAKRSGLIYAEPFLRQLKESGVGSTLIVGIDQGGATRQGLELSKSLFGRVFIYHDETGRTFHPKLYVVRGPERALVFVGSNNLTEGGIHWNYEAAILLELDPARSDEDATWLNELLAYVDALIEDEAACKTLSDALLPTLAADPRYRIGDEDRRRTGESDGSEPSAGPTPLPGVFGKSGLAKGPRPSRPSPSAKAAPPPGAERRSQAPPPLQPPPIAPAAVQDHWCKKLPASDAQHPPTPGTSPTGNLRLVQAGHAIDSRTFFRRVMFGRAAWTTRQTPRGPVDEAWVPFEVVAGESYLGSMELLVDDAPFRESGQHNHTSTLHWGHLSPVMRAVDYTKKYVVIESLSDGRYRLAIVDRDPHA